MNRAWQTQYLLLDNTFQGVCRAMELAGQGEEVILAVEETYLAVDICGQCLYKRQEIPAGFFPEECFADGVMIPDRCKQYLEERCLEAGVKFYYGLYFVEETGQQGERADSDLRMLHLAGKGGLISVCCKYVRWHREEADLNGMLSLRAWTRDKRNESCGLLEASIACDRAKTPAENLLALRQELLAEFQRKRNDNPHLVLGRFADRWGGRPETGSPAGKLDTHETAVGKGDADGSAAGIRDTDEAAFGKEDMNETAETADVIVAGGGTAGAMAALYAARGGARTILIEPMYDLGGTATLGGVNAYWFGTSFLDTQEVDERVDRLCESCGIERPAGMFGRYDVFHGVMPEVVYELNLLSHGKRFSMKPYALVTDRLVEGERDYESIRKGIFTYVESIAYAGERSRRKEFIPLLCRLTELPEFKEAFAEENKIGLMSQRWQILWVILNRTLLLLGSREGENGLLRAVESGSAAIRAGAEKALSEGLKRKEGC